MAIRTHSVESLNMTSRRAKTLLKIWWSNFGLVSGPMLHMACTGCVSDMLGYKISLVFIKEIRQKHEEISEKEEQVGNNFKAKTFK